MSASEAARRANLTRKVKAAAAEMAATYGDEKYDLLSDLIVPYLVTAVGDGGRVADLLGGGRSCRALTDAGLRVVAVDDLRLYTKKSEGGKGYDREFARMVAEHIASEAGAERLHIGDAADVLGEVDAFYFDGMGPLGPSEPAGRFLASLRKHPNVRHVVVTYMASRVAGLGSVSNGDSEVYHLAAEATMRRLGFSGLYWRAYKSRAVPMGIAIACSHVGAVSCPARQKGENRTWRRDYVQSNRSHLAESRRAWREANREVINEKKRADRRANLERDRARERAYRAANRELFAQRERERRAADPEKYRARDRANYFANHEREKAQKREYYAQHRDRLRAELRERYRTDPAYKEMVRQSRARWLEGLRKDDERREAINKRKNEWRKRRAEVAA